MKTEYLLFAALLTAYTARAQTVVDLSSQTKNVDFSKAVWTKPMKTGTSLPAVCSPGEFFFRLDAPPGRNTYACTATNVWTENVPSGPTTPSSGDAGKVLTNDGSALLWSAIGGDVSGAPAALNVVKLQGKDLSSQAPVSGDMLRWNAATEMWEPAPGTDSYLPGHGIVIAGSTIAVDDTVTPVYYTGEGTPTLDCVTARDYYVDLFSHDLYYCKSDNSWQRLSGDSHVHDAAAIMSGTLSHSLIPVMGGDAGSGGMPGAVPAPGAGDAAAGKYLKADGTWAAPSGGEATQTTWLPFGHRGGITSYSDWYCSTGSPCSVTSITEGSPHAAVVATVGASGTTMLQTVTVIPYGWSGSTIDILMHWTNTSTGGTGNLRLEYGAQCLRDADAANNWTTTITPAGVTVTPPQSTANAVFRETISSVTITGTGCAAGDLLSLRIYRLGDDALDTYEQSVYFIGTRIKWN